MKAFAPGRVELLGNHTDYNEGVVLSAALDLGIIAEGCAAGFIRLRSGEADCRFPLPVDGLEPSGEWTDYPLGVIRVLAAEGYSIGGMDVEFSSTLPSGAGLSSSAAIEVATAILLTKLGRLEMAPLELARLCRRAENEFVGVNCGLLDQATSVFGRRNEIVFLDCREESVDTIPVPPGIGLLIVDSGVKHALTGGEYNERRQDCFAAASLLGVAALRDARSDQLAGLPDRIRRRALHITGENERVLAARDALRHGDVARMGHLMSESHRSSIRNFENSTEELDLLCGLACQSPGLFGARLTGGGFGGSIVALGLKEALPAAGERVVEEYGRISGNTARAWICSPGPGAWQLLSEQSE